MSIKFNQAELVAELKAYADDLNNKPMASASEYDNADTLVVVVDMIKGFCTTGMLASPRSNSVAMPIKKMLDLLPKTKRAFFRDCHGADATEFNFFPSHCTGDIESELVDELKGVDNLDIPKNSTNGFFELIKKIPNVLDYKNVLIVGVCTDICVMQFALTLRAYANENNAKTNIVSFTDYVETYSMPTHNGELMNICSLKLLEQSGVKLFKAVK